MALSQKLGMGGAATGAALGNTAASALQSQARQFGLDPTSAVAGMRGQIANTGATNAFNNAMSVAGSQATRHLGLANQIQPNYNAANVAGLVGDLTNAYALYKGYRG